MGYTRWDDDDWKSYSSTTSAKPAAAIFTSKNLHPDLNPYGVVVRESRDSDLNPQSNAIIVAVDVTGSMGVIADYFVKTGLGVLFENILDRKPVTDPQLMIMAVGDIPMRDRSPFQVSQFEADIEIAKQLEKVHVEHGGGGNGYESYEMTWFFAANHVSMDCWEKRQKKGYLFTIGDEETSMGVIRDQVEKVLGYRPEADISLEDMYEIVSRTFHVYHIIVKEGDHCRHHFDRVLDKWIKLMGEHAIVLDDYTKLSEVIESIIEVNEGADVATVAASWSGDTSLVVANALSGTKAMAKVGDAGSVVRF